MKRATAVTAAFLVGLFCAATAGAATRTADDGAAGVARVAAVPSFSPQVQAAPPGGNAPPFPPGGGGGTGGARPGGGPGGAPGGGPGRGGGQPAFQGQLTDVPAQDLFGLAPQGTFAILAMDGTRLPADLLSQTQVQGQQVPIKPEELKKVVVFIQWSDGLLQAMQSGNTKNVPASVIIQHSASPDQVKPIFSSGQAVSQVNGVQVYKLPQNQFGAIASDGSLLVSTTESRISSLIQSYEQKSGAGIPTQLKPALAPHSGTAIALAAFLPPQLMQQAGASASIPPFIRGLSGASLGVSFPAQDLDVKGIALFRNPQQAAMIAQMVKGQLNMLKSSGAGGQGGQGGGQPFPAQPGGPGGGQGPAGGPQMPSPMQGMPDAVKGLLDSLQVSTNQGQMILSFRAPLSELKQAAQGVMSQAMAGAMTGGGPGQGGSSGAMPQPPFGPGGQEETASAPPEGEEAAQPEEGGETAAAPETTQAQPSAGQVLSTATKESGGAELKLTLKQGEWLMQQTLVIDGRINNRSDEPKMVVYRYELLDGSGNVVAEQGGGNRLRAGETARFQDPVPEDQDAANITDLRIKYVDTLSVEEEDE